MTDNDSGLMFESQTENGMFYRCTAEEISECVERDSRRYDNGFEIY